MSRIEQALEKAVKMRETAAKPVVQEEGVPDRQADALQFIVGDSMIDRSAVDKHIVCISDPNSLAAEQYNKLKVRLINATVKDGRKTLMVTSADIGEGKSITALNLAIAMAKEIDYTVLLVDADLRNPSVHRYLGIQTPYGLSEYLKGEVSLSQVLLKTGIDKLVVLPAGNPPDNPSELLSAERMKALIQELKQRYQDRYIIFDTPPILTISDSLSLGGSMDGVLFVVQEGSTSQKTATQAAALMKGWNILGAVFNNVPEYLIKGGYAHYYARGNQGPDSRPDSGRGKDAKTKQ